MEQELDEAREPAYGNEIAACDSLIRLLDPTTAPEAKAPLLSSKFGATAQRTVDDSGMKGTRLAKKGDDEESYFIGGGGKKGRKGKKGDAPTATKATDMGIFYAPGVAEHFERVGVKQPGSADDQPRVLEEVKSKKQYFLENQDKKTKEVSLKACGIYIVQHYGC